MKHVPTNEISQIGEIFKSDSAKNQCLFLFVCFHYFHPKHKLILTFQVLWFV